MKALQLHDDVRNISKSPVTSRGLLFGQLQIAGPHVTEKGAQAAALTRGARIVPVLEVGRGAIEGCRQASPVLTMAPARGPSFPGPKDCDLVSSPRGEGD